MVSKGHSKTYVDYRDPTKSVKEIAKEIDVEKIKILAVIGQGKFHFLFMTFKYMKNTNFSFFRNISLEKFQ